MKKNSSSPSQKVIKVLAILSMLLSILFIQSCNEKKEDKDAKAAANDDSVGTTVAPPAAMTNGPYSVLMITKQQLVDAFNNSSKKMLIQFRDENTPASTICAQVYGARMNGTIVPGGPYILAPASDVTLTVEGMVALGNNEVSLKQVRDYLNINGNITLGNAQVLYLYPKKDPDNYIRYYISTTLTGEITAQITYPPSGFESKPSPPADPCNPCE